MKTMNMPGYTAEAALLPIVRMYSKPFTAATVQGTIVPQARSYYQWCYESCRDEGYGWIRCRARCGRPWA